MKQLKKLLPDLLSILFFVALSFAYFAKPASEGLVLTGHDHSGGAGASSEMEAYRKSLELGRLYRAVAERQGCGFIDCGELGFEINAVDGLHYSKADHAKLAPLAAAKIREMLG